MLSAPRKDGAGLGNKLVSERVATTSRSIDMASQPDLTSLHFCTQTQTEWSE